MKCPARKASSNRCRKIGHDARVCGRKDDKGVNIVETWPDTDVAAAESGNVVAADWDRATQHNSQSDNKVVRIYQMSSQPIEKEMIVIARIGGRNIRFLADTGAAVSTINRREIRVEMLNLRKAEFVFGKALFESFRGQIDQWWASGKRW